VSDNFRKKFLDSLSFRLSDDDESVGGEGSQNFRFLELDDGVIILEHVDFTNFRKRVNIELLNGSLELLVIIYGSLDEKCIYEFNV